MLAASRLSCDRIFTGCTQEFKISAIGKLLAISAISFATPFASYAETTSINHTMRTANNADDIQAERVLCMDKRGEPWKVGTASKINETTRLTAYHVVKNCGVIYIGTKAYKVSYKDPSIDLAILGYGRDFRNLNCNSLPKNEAVTLIGYPEGSKQKIVSQGVTKRDKKSKFAAVEGFAMKGMSGGPVIQSNGQLTGLFKAYRGTSRYWYVAGPEICESVASLKGAIFQKKTAPAPIEFMFSGKQDVTLQPSLVSEKGPVDKDITGFHNAKTMPSVSPIKAVTVEVEAPPTIKFEELPPEARRLFEVDAVAAKAVSLSEAPPKLLAELNTKLGSEPSALLSPDVRVEEITEQLIENSQHITEIAAPESKTIQKHARVMKVKKLKKTSVNRSSHSSSKVQEVKNEPKKVQQVVLRPIGIKKPYKDSAAINVKNQLIVMDTIEKFPAVTSRRSLLKRSPDKIQDYPSKSLNSSLENTSYQNGFFKGIIAYLSSKPLFRTLVTYLVSSKEKPSKLITLNESSENELSIFSRIENLDDDQILKFCETSKMSDT